MKVWLDAKLEPEVQWVWAKTAHCALTLLKGGCVERISLAPDQSELTAEVTDWMIASDSPAHCTVHPVDGGVKVSRLLRIPPQKIPADRVAS